MKIEIVIENKVSVSNSLLYIGTYVSHFQCLKANPTIMNLFFPTDTRHYQLFTKVEVNSGGYSPSCEAAW